MSEQHTKEPWKVSGTEHIVAGGNYVVALDCKPKDARRIVSAVNACAGIPTDDLEQCPSGGMFHLADHANELVKQRDELLNYVESEYAELADVRNNWPGRHTLEGQAKLCRLRDLICEITGRDAEDVQDDFSNRLAVIVLKENTK